MTEQPDGTTPHPRGDKYSAAVPTLASDGSGGGVAKALVLGVLPLACLAVLVLPLLLAGDDLPDRVASHFNASGEPDGSMTPTGLLVFSGLTLVLPGVVLLWLAGLRSHRMPRPWPPFLAGLGAFLAGLGAAIVAQTV
ncbi:MAG: DUF1648 domain-containing protein, partial [Actinomycetota bacterium]